MASTFQEVKLAGFLAVVPNERGETYQKVYEQNRHRVYALEFWMMDNEMSAEELMGHVFCRAFAHSAQPSPEAIDRALLAELRELGPLGVLSLSGSVCREVLGVRRNVLRTHLERAIVGVPRTERLIFLLHDVEGYEHARIARLLGITVAESKSGLYEARMRLRELVAGMQN